jgi:uncharacterized membrane protein required for colicin V production
MLPLEVVFALLVIIWGLIGAVRGFSREIGSSIAAILAMAVLSLFGPLLITNINKFSTKLTSFSIPVATSVPAGTSAFCATPSPEQFVFYSLAFSVIVFMGYQGETLGLPAKVGRVQGQILGLLVGVVNGWLIAGNLWFFLHKCANYNVPALGIKNTGVLSPTAETLVKMLPLNLIGEPIVLLGLLFLLLILRIAK